MYGEHDHLTKRERMDLTRRATSRTGRAEDARRARVILLLAWGRPWVVVCVLQRKNEVPSDRASYERCLIGDLQAGVFRSGQGMSLVCMDE